MPMAWLSNPMMPMAVPRANSAEMIGSSAAKTEPNTKSSTINASKTPSPELLKDWLLANSANCPVTDTVRLESDVLVTAWTNFVASLCGSLFGSLSKLTCRNPTVRSGLMLAVLTRLPDESYGLVTCVTLGSALIRSTMALMRWPIAWSSRREPPDAPKTTSSVSPEWPGATDFRRLMASEDSVCGKLKLLV